MPCDSLLRVDAPAEMVWCVCAAQELVVSDNVVPKVSIGHLMLQCTLGG